MEWTILAGLAPDERRAVIASTVRRRYRNGDSLFHQGDPGDTVHLLDRGHVAIRVLDRQGTIITVDVLAPGESFGEQSLIDPNARRTATATAIGNVETLTLNRAAFTDLRERHPSVSSILVDLLAAQVRRLTNQLLEAHTMPAEARVVKRLGQLARNFADGDSATLPITQEDLATLAGTTRPTANRALQALVSDGTVVLGRGRIVIPDVRRLADG